jgi:hypothetical protein
LILVVFSSYAASDEGAVAGVFWRRCPELP